MSKTKKKFQLKIGLNECTNEEYHGDTRFISSSGLKLLLKDPGEFYEQYILGNRKEYKQSTLNAFDEGSYAHTLILEPSMVDAEYAFFDGWRKAGKEWEQFKLENSGKTLISKPQKVRVEKWVEAYKQRASALELVKGGQAEATVAAEFAGMKLKARADYINIEKGYIADVKTTSGETDVDSFKLTIDKFSYQLSAALYCELFSQFYGKDFDFYFIVLGKRDNSCEVFKTSKETMEEGRAMVMKAISNYKKCIKDNCWQSPEKYAIIDNEGYEVLEV